MNAELPAPGCSNLALEEGGVFKFRFEKRSIPVQTTTLDTPARLEIAASAESTSWYCRLVMLGATSIVVGILWDISWHRTIGRDTFWTPAHMAIYLGGLLGGLTSGWLVIRTSFFGTPEARAGAVGLAGLRGPFGAWVSIWGAMAMLVSAPFDDWWHNAYGLDVKILSPPHTVLALGMWAVVLGALLLVLREQNTGASAEAARGRWFFVYAAGVMLAMGSVFLTEMSFPNHQHSALFYTMSAATYPFYLLGIARAARFRWGATIIALIYMAIMAGASWVLPLFPGEPKLGPIYNHVEHFVALPFPLLLFVPALAIDSIRHGIGDGHGWRWDLLIAALSAIVFVALLLVTQWYFSEFMLSPAADNWFFGGNRHWGYTESLGEWRTRFFNEMNPASNPPVTIRVIGRAILLAFASSVIGLRLGNWMARVRR